MSKLPRCKVCNDKMETSPQLLSQLSRLTDRTRDLCFDEFGDELPIDASTREITTDIALGLLVQFSGTLCHACAHRILNGDGFAPKMRIFEGQSEAAIPRRQP